METYSAAGLNECHQSGVLSPATLSQTVRTISVEVAAKGRGFVEGRRTFGPVAGRDERRLGFIRIEGNDFQMHRHPIDFSQGVDLPAESNRESSELPFRANYLGLSTSVK